MGKRKFTQVDGFIDFGTLEYEEPKILVKAAGIASQLLENDAFFDRSYCEVLREIAREHGLCAPTKENIRTIRQNMRCTLSITENPDVYMECAPEMAQIFINEQVSV